MKNREVFLQRVWSDKNQTTGSLYVLDMETRQPIFGSLCIERGDRNNEKNVSRVYAGRYKLVREYSPKFNRMLWEMYGTEGRSECKIHPSNYWDQLNGCIAPGKTLSDMDHDGYFDVTSSGDTLDLFHKALDGLEETYITIINEVKF